MTFTEIINLIQRNTGTQSSTASSYPIADKTVDVNNALNNYFIKANQYAGNWRPVDDTNQTDYPVIYGDVVSSQQDYSFATDENGNQILDIYRVRILLPDGVTWKTLKQIDQSNISDSQLDITLSGTPSEYYLNSSGIFLVQKPNYSSTDGLEVSINRTSTYFLVSDTTKKAGIPWVHHEYLALRPSYFYCLNKGLPQANAYKIALDEMEKDIKVYYSNRNRAIKRSLGVVQQNNR